jgi:hypothetical protein
MSFVGLALNYGFHPDFAVRWLKAAATSYVVVVPMLMIIVRGFSVSSCGRPDCRRAKVRSPQKQKTPAQTVVSVRFFLNVPKGERHDDET